MHSLQKYLQTQGTDSLHRFYVYAYIRVKATKNGNAGTPYYIGKGTGPRAWVKHRHIHFTPEQVVIIAHDLTEIGAQAIERRLIRWWGKLIDNSGCLLNITDGGDGVSGYVRTRDQITKAQKTKLKNLQAVYGNQYVAYSQLPEVRERRACTNQQRYGGNSPFDSIEVQRKSRTTVQSKYGVSNVSLLEDVHKKKVDTYLDRYGAEYYLQTEEFKVTSAATNLLKYGVTNVFASPDIQNQIRSDCLKQYGVEYHQSRPEVRKKISDALRGKPKSLEHKEKMKIVHERQKEMVQAFDTRTEIVVKISRTLFESDPLYEGATAKPRRYYEPATGNMISAYKRDPRIATGNLVDPEKFDRIVGPTISCLCCKREHYMGHFSRHLTNNYKKTKG